MTYNGPDLPKFGEIHWLKDPRISTRRISIENHTHQSQTLRDQDKDSGAAREEDTPHIDMTHTAVM